jgi:hypothetical protein
MLSCSLFTIRPRTSIQFHTLQLNILTQAFSLLKPGGRLVYSTCSLNPIEDEAVIAGCLDFFGQESIRLVGIEDILTESPQLKHLRHRKGLEDWQSDLDIFLAGETDPQERKETTHRIGETLPRTIHTRSFGEEVLHQLPRCIRIFPQDQNTGGFFIAILEKKCSLHEKKSINPTVPQNLPYGKTKKKTLNTMKEIGYNPKQVDTAAHVEDKNSNSLFVNSRSSTKVDKSCEAEKVLQKEFVLLDRYDAQASDQLLSTIFGENQLRSTHRLVVNKNEVEGKCAEFSSRSPESSDIPLCERLLSHVHDREKAISIYLVSNSAWDLIDTVRTRAEDQFSCPIMSAGLLLGKLRYFQTIGPNQLREVKVHFETGNSLNPFFEAGLFPCALG